MFGGPRSKLNQSALKTIALRLPTSKDEQTGIVEILSTVDRAIQQTEALIVKQQRIKTGLMQDLLTRGIDKHGNLRREQTHAFKDFTSGTHSCGMGGKVARAVDLAHSRWRTPHPGVCGIGESISS